MPAPSPFRLNKHAPALSAEQTAKLKRLSELQLQTFNEADVREEFIVPIVELLARSHSSLESAALRVRVRAANNERGLLHRIVKLADRGQLDGTSEASILCGFCQRCVAAALPLDRARDHHAEKEINGRGTCVDTHRGKASAAHPPF